MIDVVINGADRRLAPGATVADVVDALGGGRRGIAVAINAEVVPRSAWEATTFAVGDRVEVLRAVQGGC